MFDFLYNFLYRKKERVSAFKNNMELDFGYVHKDGTSYRGNAYMYMNKIGIALRRISESMPNLLELGIPKSIGKVLQAKQ
jgi:Tfp pilus assembly ATPase PilU